MRFVRFDFMPLEGMLDAWAWCRRLRRATVTWDFQPQSLHASQHLKSRKVESVPSHTLQSCIKPYDVNSGILERQT